MSDQIIMNLPSNIKYLNILGASLQALLEYVTLEDAEGQIYGIVLAVHEICTNICEHAYEGDTTQRISVKIELDEQNRYLQVDIFDDSSNHFQEVVSSDFDEADIVERGRGLFLVQQLMDEVIYEQENGKNHWMLKKILI